MNLLSIRAVVIQTIAMIAAIWIGIQIGSENFEMMIVILALFLGALGLLIPNLSVIAIIRLQFSGITLPGLPLQLTLFNILGTFIMLQAIFRRVFKTNTPWKLPLTYYWILAFVALIVFTMGSKGSGIRQLGSSDWGGFVYIQLLFASGLAFALPESTLTPNQWKNSLIWMGVASLLPLAADLFSLQLGNLFIWNFIHGSGGIADTYFAQMTPDSVVRYGSAGSAGFDLLFSFMIVFGTERMFSLQRLPLLLFPLIFMLMILISGFRSMILEYVLFLSVLMWIQKSLTMRNLLKLPPLLIAGFILAYSFASKLPLSAQRALSFIPGLNISHIASDDATGSTDWRLILWSRALAAMPGHWLFGHGCTFDSKSLLIATDPNLREDNIEWALITNQLHNGPLTLLSAFGIVGLIICTGMFITPCIRHFRISRNQWFDPILHRCHQTVTAWVIASVIFFYSIIGGLEGSIPTFLFFVGLLEALWCADLRLKEAATQDNQTIIPH